VQHLRFDQRLLVNLSDKGAANICALVRFHPMVYVQSTALEQVTYDPEAHVLRATFRETGRTYAYRDVPQEVYDGLLFADSLGAYFNAHIRDQFDFEEL
jgi:KTSC domain-containing protein